MRWSNFHYPINKPNNSVSQEDREWAIIIGWAIFCKYHLSSIELYFAFLAKFFGWSLTTLFLEKHDIKVSTKFSSSTKKPKLRQFVPGVSWLLSLFLTTAYCFDIILPYIMLSRQIPFNVSSFSINCRNETFFVAKKGLQANKSWESQAVWLAVVLRLLVAL